jgi:hypothetical protein
VRFLFSGRKKVFPCAFFVSGKKVLVYLGRYLGTLQNGLFAQSHRCSEKFYPRNIRHMPAAKFSSRLDLERKFSFFKAPICIEG